MMRRSFCAVSMVSCELLRVRPAAAWDFYVQSAYPDDAKPETVQIVSVQVPTHPWRPEEYPAAIEVHVWGTAEPLSAE